MSIVMGIIAIIFFAISPLLQQYTTPRERTPEVGAALRHTDDSEIPPFLALDLRTTRNIREIYDKKNP